MATAQDTGQTTELNLPPNWVDLTQTQRDFLTAYLGCGSVTKAADIARCSKVTHYTALQRSEQYKEAWERIRAIAAYQLVDTMLERAIYGRKKFKFNSKGEPLLFPVDVPELKAKQGDPYFELEHPEVTGIYLTKALAGLVEKQHQVVEHTGSIEKKLTVQVYLPGREQHIPERVSQDEHTETPTIIEATGSRRTTD